MEQLIRQALNVIAHLGNSKRVTLFSVLDNYSGTIIGGLVGGEITLPNKSVQFKNTPLEKVILTKQTRTYPCTLLDLLPFPVYKETFRNFECLCLPLLTENNQIKGVAVLSQKTGTTLSSGYLHLFKTICPLVTSIVEINLKNEQALQSSTYDNLTHLYTQHYLKMRLQGEYSRIRRHGGVASLLQIEVDQFAKINEGYHSEEYNKVLQEMANILTDSIRKEIDIPARYDHKQFAILLPNTSVDGAYVLADRIRQRCERRIFTTSQGLPLKVTVSIGVAHNIDTRHETNPDETAIVTEISQRELMHRANLMLDAAKQAGCNKVMVWW